MIYIIIILIKTLQNLLKYPKYLLNGLLFVIIKRLLIIFMTSNIHLVLVLAVCWWPMFSSKGQRVLATTEDHSSVISRTWLVNLPPSLDTDLSGYYILESLIFTYFYRHVTWTLVPLQCLGGFSFSETL